MTGIETLLAGENWQMTPGERAAFEGLLELVRPKLGIEIGTDRGGSLARFAAHCEEVHSFDLDHSELAEPPANAVLHSGDSHELLPRFLAELEAEGRGVDLVLVDGDHSSEGARRDIDDLLGSTAISRTVIVVHDTLNGEVRDGMLAALSGDHPHVVRFEPDFVTGHLSRSGPFAGQLWGGLGLIVVDRGTAAGNPVSDDEFEDPHRIFSAFAGATGGQAARARSGLRALTARMRP